MSYVLNTESEKREMLKTIGVNSIMDLFGDIDESIIQKERLKLDKPLSEARVKADMSSLSEKNIRKLSFLGAGSYNHFIPSVINHMLLRSEFYTAYTPYQPEMSQGSLQSIFEFQTYMCRLTGMDVSNASMYDGSTALAEAASMCSIISGRKKIITSKTIHPQYREVVKTYCSMYDIEYKEVGYEGGITDCSEIEKCIGEDVAGVLVQNPNFFGCVEDIKKIREISSKTNSMLVVCVVEAISLGLLEPPKTADIVVGEGQSFGIPKSYGGPAFGFMCVKKEYMRKIPGRLVGETVDMDKMKGYIMTLTAREQHIRREKSTSNLCTNQALLALAGSVYLSIVGKQLKDIALINAKKAKYLQENLDKIGIKKRFPNPFFNEFAVKIPNSESVIGRLEKSGIEAGLNLERHYPELKDCILVCSTETHSKEDAERLIEKIKGALDETDI